MCLAGTNLWTEAWTLSKWMVQRLLTTEQSMNRYILGLTRRGSTNKLDKESDERFWHHREK